MEFNQQITSTITPNDETFKHVMGSSYIDGYGSVDYSIVDGLKPGERRELKKGNEGADVTEMKNLLLKWKKDCLPEYGADGDFGTETQNAVKAFQTDKGLNVTGVCDKLTWEALEAFVSKVVTVKGGTVYVRKAANTSASILGVARKGDKYTYRETAANGWFGIEYMNSIAYISNKYSEVANG